MKLLARISTNRRRLGRRTPEQDEIVSLHRVFSYEERIAFRQAERRRRIRRATDVRRAVAQLER